jgi:hypothetical protein
MNQIALGNLHNQESVSFLKPFREIGWHAATSKTKIQDLTEKRAKVSSRESSQI